jgi:4-amino-4-deoxy-L-arabinose transferase-like glycosyltransferase
LSDQSSPDSSASDTVGPASVPLAIKLLFAVLVTYRLAYHATYMGEVPFALGTFSDGALYEQMARDILAEPPLGTQPFYLQGFYAYFLAAAMVVRPWIAMGLMAQVLLACGANWLFFRSVKRLWGRRAAWASAAVLLAYPALAFYENKFLSAELGVACNIAALWAFSRLLTVRDQRSQVLWSVAVGATAGLAVLARPNMFAALPFTVGALVLLARELPTRRWRRAALLVAPSALGFILAVSPMALRNQAVTGVMDLGPVHGGGTSFFIGNNPKSKGLWNDADMLSGRLGTESIELAEKLGLDEHEDDPRARAREVGEALYVRAFDWIAENPGDWVVLEGRKLWLVVGNDEATQDYDWYGERELIPWAHRVGLPFSVILALAVLGLWGARRMGPPGRCDEWGGSTLAEGDAGNRWRRRAFWLMWLGQIAGPLAANLVYFTSSQHRLPLVIPLALVSGVGLVAALKGWRESPRTRPGLPWLVVVALIVAQGFWPRLKRHEPHPVHYYNLAVIQDETGSPLDALVSYDRAVELRPDQSQFRLRRAHLLYRLGDLDAAELDLRYARDLANQPSWVGVQAKRELAFIAEERQRRVTQPNVGQAPR